ncbi:hypothetical protein [Streptomyces sp. AMCC400023]|uniref:hypothetical protein n=1 Tax=Streptomyces sp. AMCC400023 TaxID=2056258 RepID=UPI001F450420|nr:hypothetical protein [Streptomyces sp. AMCC400023]
MAKYRITTPVPGFTGVSVGVNFTKGVAEIDVDEDDRQHPTTRALAYFWAQGYGVEEIERDEPEPVEEPDDGPKAPARSASKSDWAAYATSQGMDADEADKLTRDQLAERFLDQKEG